MLGILKWFKNEIIHLIPALMYFLVCFNLLHFSQTLMLQPHDIRFTSYLGATLGAVLAGKIILIVENLPFINAFPNKPIIWNITWKFFIYSIFVLLIQIIEHACEQLYYTKSWFITYTILKTNVSQSMFWGIQIFVLIFFLIFIVFSELTHAIGQSKTRKIFFG